MITRPDEYKHTNDNYAIVDNNNVRGGNFPIDTLTSVNLLLIPLDKRGLKTVVNVITGKSYIFTSQSLVDVDWGNLSNWLEINQHPSGFSNKPATPLTSANVISQVAVNNNGHVTGVVTRQITPSDIGASASSHVHNIATGTLDGFLSSSDKTKLDNIEESADVNQNAYSTIIVNGTSVAATVEEDSFTINSGTGVNIVQTGKTITISSTGEYTHPSGFTDAPTTPLSGASVISQVDVTSEGHVNSIVSRTLTPANIGASPSTHTHNGLILTGGTKGQTLIKKSSSNYDLEYGYLNCVTVDGKGVVTVNVSTSNPMLTISTTLASNVINNYDLQGKHIIFTFTSGSTYTFTDIIDLSFYFNGQISFNTSLGTNAIFSFPSTNSYTSALGLEVGFIRLPAEKTIFSVRNITFNITFNTSTTNATVFSTFSGRNSNEREVIIVRCIFNIDCVNNGVAAIISEDRTKNISIRETSLNITNHTYSYLFSSNNTSDVAWINKGVLTHYLVAVSSTTPLTNIFGPTGPTSYGFTHIFYKHIDTLVSSIPISSPTIPYYIFTEM